MKSVFRLKNVLIAFAAFTPTTYAAENNTMKALKNAEKLLHDEYNLDALQTANLQSLNKIRDYLAGRRDHRNYQANLATVEAPADLNNYHDAYLKLLNGSEVEEGILAALNSVQNANCSSNQDDELKKQIADLFYEKQRANFEISLQKPNDVLGNETLDGKYNRKKGKKILMNESGYYRQMTLTQAADNVTVDDLSLNRLCNGIKLPSMPDCHNYTVTVTTYGDIKCTAPNDAKTGPGRECSQSSGHHKEPVCANINPSFDGYVEPEEQAKVYDSYLKAAYAYQTALDKIPSQCTGAGDWNRNKSSYKAEALAVLGREMSYLKTLADQTKSNSQFNQRIMKLVKTFHKKCVR